MSSETSILKEADYYQRISENEVVREFRRLEDKDMKGLKKRTDLLVVLRRLLANIMQQTITDTKFIQPLLLKYLNSRDEEIRSITQLIFENIKCSTSTVNQLKSLYNERLKGDAFNRAHATQMLTKLNVNTNDIIYNGILDKDPIVKRSAVLEGLSLFEMNKNSKDINKIVEKLKENLSNKNVDVSASCAAALLELSKNNKIHVIDMSFETVLELLQNVNKCSRFDKLHIYDIIMFHVPESRKDSQQIIDIVISKLKNETNISAVTTATKCIMYYLGFVDTLNSIQIVKLKLMPIFINLIHRKHDQKILYIMLCVIEKICFKFTNLIESKSLDLFFINYDDILSVKTKKLDILKMCCSFDNFSNVLDELLNCITQADETTVVRKAVVNIGVIASKIKTASDKCIDILNDLIKTDTHYIVESVIVATKVILKSSSEKHKLQDLIFNISNCFDTISETDSKMALCWIVYNYSGVKKTGKEYEIVQFLMDGYSTETQNLQLMLLSTITKCFCMEPEKYHDLLLHVLDYSTNVSKNPLLRQRAHFYQTILAKYPKTLNTIINYIPKYSFFKENDYENEECYYVDNMLNMATISSSSKSSKYQTNINKNFYIHLHKNLFDSPILNKKIISKNRLNTEEILKTKTYASPTTVLIDYESNKDDVINNSINDEIMELEIE